MIDVATDAAILSHHQHIADTARAQGGEHAQNVVCAIGDLETRRISNDAADVARRHGICNNAHERSRAPSDANETVDVDPHFPGIHE